jgi:hypothetical protein
MDTHTASLFKTRNDQPAYADIDMTLVTDTDLRRQSVFLVKQAAQSDGPIVSTNTGRDPNEDGCAQTALH